MGYRLAADLVLIAHLLFILFVMLGGLAVLRFPKVAWLHLPAVLWAALLQFNAWICPLTPLENRLRQRGGAEGFEGGFVEHYLLPLIYPPGLSPEHQQWIGLLVVGLNALLYALLAARCLAKGGRSP